MSRKGFGMTAIVDADGRVLGIFTDGDLRRVLDQKIDIAATAIGSVMTPDCTTVAADILAADALRIMQDRKINALLVVDDGKRLTGVLNMHDLLRSRAL
jgi:arabinose-5-phosphate isomerase